ncbi:PLP-dependent transferase [Gautieria morchelliformis]|nr:PLP-dependent transferase [Gautieria morchelliformis]
MGSITVLEDKAQSRLAKQPGLLDLRIPTKKLKADLFSNDFLSLTTDAKMRSTILTRLSNEQAPFVGATGSRTLDGNTPAHTSLEAKLCDYFNADAALFFNSGYDANLGMFSALPQEGDVVVYDELMHASVIDGIRLSPHASKSSRPFKHNSVASLRSVLQQLIHTHPLIRSGSSTVLVAVESLYSMNGDVAPLHQILEVMDNILPKGCGQIFVDESHSTGLYGPSGRGIVSLMGLENRIHLRLYSFSKALAGCGAAVICAPMIRTYLIGFCRPFIFTTALNPMCIIAAEEALNIAKSHLGDQLRERLAVLSSYAYTLLKKELSGIPQGVLRVPTLDSKFLSVIVPLVTPYAVPLAVRLRAQGWSAIAIFYPAVPHGEERLRITIHAANTEQEIEEFVMELRRIISDESWKEHIPSGTIVDDVDFKRITPRL